MPATATAGASANASTVAARLWHSRLVALTAVSRSAATDAPAANVSAALAASDALLAPFAPVATLAPDARVTWTRGASGRGGHDRGRRHL